MRSIVCRRAVSCTCGLRCPDRSLIYWERPELRWRHCFCCCCRSRQGQLWFLREDMFPGYSLSRKVRRKGQRWRYAFDSFIVLYREVRVEQVLTNAGSANPASASGRFFDSAGPCSARF